MRNDRWFLRMTALLAACGLLMTGVSLAARRSRAAEAGSSTDPLVTLSYLNDTFMEQILQKIDERIAARTGQTVSPAGTGSGADAFAVVTLSQGQVLTGGVGCEVMLRIGSAVCSAASEPGLVDETSGGTLSGGGALETNHLYMMTIEGRGVQATGATVKLMVRGTYQVN